MGIFFNPFYLVRKELYNGIAHYNKGLKGQLIDLGCGTKPYQHLFTEVTSYVGLDIEQSGNVDGKTAVDLFYDGKTFPLNNNSIDVVFSSETFEHIFNLPEILAEIHRVLKKDGQLLFTCPFFWPEHEAPFDYARYTSFALQHMLKEHGFEIVHQHKTGHYILVLLQAIALYIFYIINRVPIIKPILFVVFISPLFILGNVLNQILPTIMKRKDLYFNHIILAKKP